jgi:hypothetical protein
MTEIACVAQDYLATLAALVFGLGVGVCITMIVVATLSKREAL